MTPPVDESIHTCQRFDPLFVLVLELLEFLTGLFFMRLLATRFGFGSFSELVLRFANHEKLRVGIVDELGLQRNPAKISKLL